MTIEEKQEAIRKINAEVDQIEKYLSNLAFSKTIVIGHWGDDRIFTLARDGYPVTHEVKVKVCDLLIDFYTQKKMALLLEGEKLMA